MSPRCGDTLNSSSTSGCESQRGSQPKPNHSSHTNPNGQRGSKQTSWPRVQNVGVIRLIQEQVGNHRGGSHLVNHLVVSMADFYQLGIQAVVCYTAL